MTIESVARFRIVMPQSEYAALLRASGHTLRTPDAEARHIIRLDLQRRGLLPTDNETADPASAEEVCHE